MNQNEKSTKMEPSAAGEPRLPWAPPRLTVADIDSVTNNAGYVAPDYSGEIGS